MTDLIHNCVNYFVFDIALIWLFVNSKVNRSVYISTSPACLSFPWKWGNCELCRRACDEFLTVDGLVQSIAFGTGLCVNLHMFTICTSHSHILSWACLSFTFYIHTHTQLFLLVILPYDRVCCHPVVIFTIAFCQSIQQIFMCVLFCLWLLQLYFVLVFYYKYLLSFCTLWGNCSEACKIMKCQL